MYKKLSLLIIFPGLLGITILSASYHTWEESTKTTASPNIIILFADDLGYQDLSIYGSQQIDTPHLDKLAEEGMRFTDFYAGSAVCSPSRASLLTGRFALRTGVYSWIHVTHEKMHLHRDEVTIADVLKESGYSTAHIGKWHLGYDLEDGSGPAPTPGDHGFDYWFATGNNAHPSHHNPDNFIRNGKSVGEIEGYSSHILVDEAVSWIEQEWDSKTPFYLNIWFHEPHAPVAAPPEILKRHENTTNPAYYGSVENMDSAIGGLMRKLHEMGQDKKTIVIFMSDHGSYMGEYGSNGKFKKGKTTLWEGGIRVPAIIRWPGQIESGTVENEPTGVVDILPTLSEITGAELPSDRKIDGVSLMPLLKGEFIQREQPLYWFYSPSRPAIVIRNGDWNLIADPDLDIPTQNFFEEEWIGLVKETGFQNFRLYNLKKDPGQETNVASENPEIFEQMKEKMLSLHEEIVDEAIDWRYFQWP
jgi:arylsulfatase A